MLIGIDASTVATGFAFGGASDFVPKGGAWKGPGANNFVLDRTLAGMSESLFMLAKAILAEWVCIEAPLLINDSAHGAHTTMALIQLTGAMRAAATRAGCRVELVAVSTVRQHFIGQGRLRKKEAKDQVMRRCEQFGWPFKDDNQADANAVWCYGMSKHYPKWAPCGTPLFGSRSAP